MTSGPVVIQGGMGVAVSNWRLAREVSLTGQLGVVSGTALDAVFARRLQDGDYGGHMRRALDAFPVPEIAARVRNAFFKEQGRGGAPYRPTPDISLTPTRMATELAVVANFAEVWLAKQGHTGQVGINVLEKVQMATPSALLGAMIAGVDFVLAGAGIPRQIPRLLTDYANGLRGHVDVDVDGGQPTELGIDPAELLGQRITLRRPRFLAIVSAAVLAAYLHRDPEMRPDGFVVEGPVAGGHNAPPRGRLTLDETGDPIYGDRDNANLDQIAALGLPFWVAGGTGTPEGVAAALEAGAEGVQVGTLFALSEDSGVAPSLRSRLLTALREGRLVVRTDHRGSPTGFPFKVAPMTGTIGETETYEARPRLCDLGYLRVPYAKEGGDIGYRCPAEPENMWQRKGGDLADTVGRKCLCNGLMATVGLGQQRKDGYEEAPLSTLGSDLEGPRRLLQTHPEGWRARDAVAWLLSRS